jgi:hypothetical protein
MVGRVTAAAMASASRLSFLFDLSRVAGFHCCHPAP